MNLMLTRSIRPLPWKKTTSKVETPVNLQVASRLALWDQNSSGKEHPLRILLLLRSEGPRRFSEVEEATGLNPSQVDRALKLLREGMWVIPEAIPEAEGPVHVRYRLTDRGLAFLKAVDAFRTGLERHRSAIGEDAVGELESLYA